MKAQEINGINVGMQSGHIVVPDYWKASPEEVENIEYWISLVSSGQCAFYDMAFSVVRNDTDSKYLTESIYKRNISGKYSGLSVIEIFETGYISLIHHRNGYLCGIPMEFHKVLPIEAQTRYVSEQQRVVYEVLKPIEHEIVVCDLNFNPNCFTRTIESG